MTDIDAIHRSMMSQLSALDTAIANSAAWNDNQRDRLQRVRIDPLCQSAKQFALALRDLDADSGRIQALLRKV